MRIIVNDVLSHLNEELSLRHKSNSHYGYVSQFNSFRTSHGALEKSSPRKLRLSGNRHYRFLEKQTLSLGELRFTQCLLSALARVRKCSIFGLCFSPSSCLARETAPSNDGDQFQLFSCILLYLQITYLRIIISENNYMC